MHEGALEPSDIVVESVKSNVPYRAETGRFVEFTVGGRAGTYESHFVVGDDRLPL